MRLQNPAHMFNKVLGDLAFQQAMEMLPGIQWGEMENEARMIFEVSMPEEEELVEEIVHEAVVFWWSR